MNYNYLKVVLKERKKVLNNMTDSNCLINSTSLYIFMINKKGSPQSHNVNEKTNNIHQNKTYMALRYPLY